MRNELLQDGAPRTKGRSTSSCWHIITCEYPPQLGGVSDYTFGVAAGLASEGDEVHVWCPDFSGIPAESEGVTVHRDLGSITRQDLREAGRQLDSFPAPRRILVQWVPHGYGYRSMNIGFCWWLLDRTRRHGDHLEIMVHEPNSPFRANSPGQNAAAMVHRLMMMVLLRAAERVWMSIPSWEGRCRPYALNKKLPFNWLPIPSSIPVRDNPAAAREVRHRYAGDDGLLIGHFGTYGSPITTLLEPVLAGLLPDPDNTTILLIGMGSQEFLRELIRRVPRLAGRIHATGGLSAEDLSLHVGACDLMIQPYPDGVSSRRTSCMVALSHSKPTVTTFGLLTEPLWKDSGAIALAAAGDAPAFLVLIRRLLSDRRERARMSAAAGKLYQEHFEISRTVATLRHATTDTGPACAS